MGILSLAGRMVTLEGPNRTIKEESQWRAVTCIRIPSIKVIIKKSVAITRVFGTSTDCGTYPPRCRFRGLELGVRFVLRKRNMVLLSLSTMIKRFGTGDHA
jgi:hypothetical protein